MRTLVLALAGVAALGIASAGTAQVTLDGTSFEATDGPDTVGLVTTIGYTDTMLDTPNFSEWLTFTNELAGTYYVTVESSTPHLDFTSVFLTNGTTNWSLTEIFDVGTEFWSLAGAGLDAGTYTLWVNGTTAGNAGASGTITINAIPEPATWGMMLLGFGAMGFAMRRSRKAGSGLAQIA